MNKFKLQTALKVRERLEKLYQKSFAEQVQVTQRLTDQLNILEEAFQENSSAVDLAKRNGFTIADLVRANGFGQRLKYCLLYTSPSPRDVEESRMPSSA